VRVIPDTAATPIVNTAAIDVRLPVADAELRFQDTKTQERGTLRRFRSPALVPGSDYTYDITATWTEGGREISQTRQLLVRAGDQLFVDFTTAPPAQGTSTLRTGALP
jgi:uncharacterized protein (TIGR03000 family)